MPVQPSILGSSYSGITGFATASTTYYFALGFGNNINGLTQNTTESVVQITHRANATLSNLGIYMSANARGTASTLRSRIAGSNGNQSVSIGAGLTGLFRDTTNTDSITAGQTVNASLTNGTGGGNFVFHTVYAMLTPAGSNPIMYYHASGSGPNASTASTLYRGPIGGALGINLNSSSDTTVNLHVRAPGNYTNFTIDVSANTRITATTCGLRKNGSAGNNQVSVGAGVTGIVEDTTNSDTISNSDLANLYVLTGTGAGNFNVRRLGIMFTGNTQSYDWNTGEEATVQVLNGTTYYGPPFGRMGWLFGNTVEANAQIDMPFAGRASNLRMYFGLNNTSTTTLRTRKNGSNGNQAVSVIAGASGFVEDTSTHDDFQIGDLLNYSKGSAGSTSNTFNMVSMKITQQAAIVSGNGGGMIQVVT